MHFQENLPYFRSWVLPDLLKPSSILLIGIASLAGHAEATNTEVKSGLHQPTDQRMGMQVDGVVFLVDALDRERFLESKKELDGLLGDESLSAVSPLSCSPHAIDPTALCPAPGCI